MLPIREPINCKECGAELACHVVVGDNVYIEIGGIQVMYIPELASPICINCGNSIRGLSCPDNVPHFLATRGKIKHPEAVREPANG